MALTTTTSYAIQALTYLAQQNDEVINSKELSEKAFVSQNYLLKLM